MEDRMNVDRVQVEKNARASQIEVRSSQTGLGVFTSADLKAMTRTTQFAGPEMPLQDVHAAQLNYVLRATRDLYLVPETSARFVNHSCEPNCFIDDDLFIVTRHEIPAGTELTISYNRISDAEAAAWGDFWHPAWTFNCQCGTPRCCGSISKYIIDEVKPYAQSIWPVTDCRR